MRHIHIAALAAAALLTLAGCSSEPEPAFNAQAMVDELGNLYPLPHPRDNTSACQGDDADHAHACLQLISTDPVSVYELKTKKAAAHWTKLMSRAGNNKPVQAGRFMLLWKADYPSHPDAVAEMTRKAKTLAAKE